MQHLTCHRDYGLGRRMAERGLLQLREAYFTGVDRIVPRIEALIAACRAASINISYATIAAASQDGRDLSPLTRHHGLIATKGSKEEEVLSALSPGPRDLRLTRSTLSVLTPQSAEQFLRNMGVETLLVTGVMTDASIESTARDAGDRGFFTIVAGDACWALDAEDHRRALEPLDMWYGHVVTTGELIAAIRAGTAVA
jgi:ureidoacrylate peracid hydrolase